MSRVCRNLLQNVPTLGNLSILNPKQIIDGDRLVAPCPFYDTFTEEMLQGDGWRGFQLFMFDPGDRRSVRGLVLSNSCNVDPDNPRDVPARVVFAPLVNVCIRGPTSQKRDRGSSRGRQGSLHKVAENDQHLLLACKRAA